MKLSLFNDNRSHARLCSDEQTKLWICTAKCGERLESNGRGVLQPLTTSADGRSVRNSGPGPSRS